MAMLHLAVLLCVWLLASTGADASSTQRTAAINTLLAQSATGSTSTSGHSNNWAVIVCSSRYWLNYRHGVDAMAVYHEVKRLGIPDTNIIVMMADDYACNARNTFPGRMYANESYLLDVYGGGDVEVDYRGVEVTPQALTALLTGRHDPSVPRSKRMLSDAGSNVLVYMAGHGGDGFLKFLDTQELLDQDLADALAQASAKGRFHELLVIAETCEAETLLRRIATPGVLTLATSKKGEKSLAHTVDYTIGISQLDRFTFQTLNVLQSLDISSTYSAEQLLQMYDPAMLQANFAFRKVHFARDLASVRVTDFFGGVASAILLHKVANFAGEEWVNLSQSQAEGSAQLAGGQVLPESRKLSEAHSTESSCACDVNETSPSHTFTIASRDVRMPQPWALHTGILRSPVPSISLLCVNVFPVIAMAAVVALASSTVMLA